MPLVSIDLVAGSRERLVAALQRAVLRVVLKPALSPAIPIVPQRKWFRTLARLTRPNIDAEADVLGGVSGEWLRQPGAMGRGAILYLHGGGYCTGSSATHRTLTSQLAKAAALPVFAADYRLAPEWPFPAAVEDAVHACLDLSERDPFVIAGDSAGGGLAVAATLALRERQAQMPAALVLFSPWVDLAMASPFEPVKGDVMLSPRWLAACARHYLAGADASAPLASPIHGDLQGLPPTLIQAGTDDLLRRDAVRLCDALERAGVTVRCEIVRDRWHGFQLHAGMLPSADAAIGRAAQFIRRAIDRDIG